jgi:hypothetical protein
MIGFFWRGARWLAGIGVVLTGLIPALAEVPAGRLRRRPETAQYPRAKRLARRASRGPARAEDDRQYHGMIIAK